MLRKEARSAEIVDLRHDRARLGGTARLGAGSASQGTVLWVGSLWDHRGPEARLWGEVGERQMVLFLWSWDHRGLWSLAAMHSRRCT